MYNMDMRARFDGRMVSTARRAANMDQAELARRVSRNRVTISDIERGKLKPSRKLAESIARVLGLEPASLYAATPEIPPAGGMSLSVEEIEVVDAMRRVDEVQRAKIWGFARGLAAGGGAEGAAAAAELAEAGQKAARVDQAESKPHAGSA